MKERGMFVAYPINDNLLVVEIVQRVDKDE
jgi:hypothetical protein